MAVAKRGEKTNRPREIYRWRNRKTFLSENECVGSIAGLDRGVARRKEGRTINSTKNWPRRGGKARSVVAADELCSFLHGPRPFNDFAGALCSLNIDDAPALRQITSRNATIATRNVRAGEINRFGGSRDALYTRLNVFRSRHYKPSVMSPSLA